MSNVDNNSLQNQIRNVIRYFKVTNPQELEQKLHKCILRLNKAKNIADLTAEQLTKSLHHLYNMEQTMYVYYFCMQHIEQQLFGRFLSRELDNDNRDFMREFNGSEKTGRIVNLASNLVNVNMLSSLH